MQGEITIKYWRGRPRSPLFPLFPCYSKVVMYKFHLNSILCLLFYSITTIHSKLLFRTFFSLIHQLHKPPGDIYSSLLFFTHNHSASFPRVEITHGEPIVSHRNIHIPLLGLSCDRNYWTKVAIFVASVFATISHTCPGKKPGGGTSLFLVSKPISSTLSLIHI